MDRRKQSPKTPVITATEETPYEGKLTFNICQTLSCLIEKNIKSCYECDEFPCAKVKDE